MYVAPTSNAPPPRRVSAEAYLADESVSETKHEFIDGDVRAMPGASRNHISVTTVLTRIVDQSFRDKGGCRFLNSDVQICIPSHKTYTYPDGVIACPPQYAKQGAAALLNPKVIFEVLSPSTEAYDRGGKFRRYRSLETLEEYVLVSTTEPIVEVFSRPEWGVRTYEGLDAVVRLPSVGLELSIRDLYADIDWTVPA